MARCGHKLTQIPFAESVFLFAVIISLVGLPATRILVREDALRPTLCVAFGLFSYQMTEDDLNKPKVKRRCILSEDLKTAGH